MKPMYCRAHYILEQIRKAEQIHAFYYTSCDRAFDPLGITVTIRLEIKLMVDTLMVSQLHNPHTVNGIADTCVCLSFKQKVVIRVRLHITCS